IICDWDTRKVLRRQHGSRDSASSVKIRPLKGNEVRQLSADDIPLVFLTRNDRRFLNSFLAHYRRLGVTRFICVDDASDDGTREALLAEPDVDVFASNVRYKEARRGRLWREILFSIYGANRWYLNVDSDEYFIYAN